MHRLKSGVDSELWTLDSGLSFIYVLCRKLCRDEGGWWGLGGCCRVRVRALGVQEQPSIFSLSSHAFLPYLL